LRRLETVEYIQAWLPKDSLILPSIRTSIFKIDFVQLGAIKKNKIEITGDYL
jgi:hypothetical protein